MIYTRHTYFTFLGYTHGLHMPGMSLEIYHLIFYFFGVILMNCICQACLQRVTENEVGYTYSSIYEIERGLVLSHIQEPERLGCQI